ncbi:MAG: hypothetical protein IJI05_01940 [Erysipelotrichaceae bacterium]|nr:hypothetical protein [Erysipelotrichaceae bacterium]
MSRRLAENIIIDDDGIGYVEMLVPEPMTDLRISVKKEYPRYYEGYGYPFRYLITLRPEDRSYQLGVISGRSYPDDHLMSFEKENVDEFGVYLKHFPGFPDYVDEFAARCNPDKKLAFVRQNNNPREEQDAIKARKEMERVFEKDRSMYSIMNYMYTQADRLYSYENDKNQKRFICYSMVMEACQYVRWEDAPEGNIADLQQYPYVYYDERFGKNMYAAQYETVWNVSEITAFDCAADKLEESYADFCAIISHGQKLCPQIKKAFRDRQQEIDKQLENERIENRLRLQRAQEEYQSALEEEKIKKIWQDYYAQKREMDSQMYEYVRNRQQEIADIHQSAYQNSNATWDRATEKWSDVFRGDKRFTDRQGREYVVHTTDDHVYKSGNTYVTSDRPLGHALDWDELKKKKY